MAADENRQQPGWSTCEANECIGIQLAGQRFCLAHVEEASRTSFLAALGPGSDLDLRGTPIEPDLLATVLAALKEGVSPRLRHAKFNRARFAGDACFQDAQFAGEARFDGAQFSGEARFDRAQFSGTVWFRAQFQEDAWFLAAKFSQEVLFDGAWFKKQAWFNSENIREVNGCS